MALFDGQPPALSKGSTIVVTGANSFIGSHVCNELLQLGYKVKGSVRDKDRCKWIIDHFVEKYSDLFEAVVVTDLSSPGAFDTLLQDVSGLAHVATEAFGGYDPNIVVDATVSSTLRIFRSAHKSKMLKRFVLTSSSSALHSANPRSKEPNTITAQDWNIDAVARAWASPPYTPDRFFDVYAASKTQSEHALWKALRESDTDIVVNTVAPDTNFGPSIVPTQKSSTGKILYDAWKQGDGAALKSFVDGGYRWLVDVRDVASLHVSALLDPDVHDERLLGYAHKYNGHQLVDFFNQHNRDFGIDQEVKPALPEDWSCIDFVETSRSEEALRRLENDGWIAKETTLRENLQD